MTLTFYDSVLNGNARQGDVTELLKPTWRRSRRRVGDYWLGTAEVRGSKDDLDDLFSEGLMREIRETTVGEETWRGAIVKMEYTRKGDVFVRDITRMRNAIRSIYTRIGDNLLTNGSGETGAWTAWNGATVAQDATWATQGTYSMKITVNDATVRGALVQSTIAIVAGQQYIIRGTLKVTSGSWRFSSNQAGTDVTMAFDSTRGGTGDFAFNIEIPATNTWTGNVDLRISSEAAAGVVNVDGCVFQVGPARAETGWYTDTESINTFGRKEEIYLRSGMSNDDANGECESALIDLAWPLTAPPRSGRTLLAKSETDVIRLTFAGYWAMLNWLYTTLAGTKTKAEWIAALVALQSTFVTAGVVDANTTDFFVEDRGPLRVGDLLRDLTLSGEAGGAKYAIGVGAGRKLNYQLIPEQLAYIRRGGRLYSVANEEMDPALVKPGWALWEDMPIGAGWITTHAQHKPRWSFLEEVELLPPTKAEPNGSIAFKLD